MVVCPVVVNQSTSQVSETLSAWPEIHISRSVLPDTGHVGLVLPSPLCLCILSCECNGPCADRSGMWDMCFGARLCGPLRYRTVQTDRYCIQVHVPVYRSRAPPVPVLVHAPVHGPVPLASTANERTFASGGRGRLPAEARGAEPIICDASHSCVSCAAAASTRLHRQPTL